MAQGARGAAHGHRQGRRLPGHAAAHVVGLIAAQSGFTGDGAELEVLSGLHLGSSLPISPRLLGSLSLGPLAASDSQVHFYISYSCSSTGPAPS